MFPSGSSFFRVAGLNASWHNGSLWFQMCKLSMTFVYTSMLCSKERAMAGEFLQRLSHPIGTCHMPERLYPSSVGLCFEMVISHDSTTMKTWDRLSDLSKKKLATCFTVTKVNQNGLDSCCIQIFTQGRTF